MPYAPLLLVISAVTAFVPTIVPVHHKGFTRLAAEVTLDGETIRGPIAPLGNYVLVSTKDTLAATSGGILLPDQVRPSFDAYITNVVSCVHVLKDC